MTGLLEPAAWKNYLQARAIGLLYLLYAALAITLLVIIVGTRGELAHAVLEIPVNVGSDQQLVSRAASMRVPIERETGLHEPVLNDGSRSYIGGLSAWGRLSGVGQLRHDRIGGLEMALALLASVLILSSFRQALTSMPVFAPALLAAFSIPVLSLCDTCRLDGKPIDLLLRWGLLALPWCLLVGRHPGLSSGFQSALRFLPASMLAVQGALLLIEPKFCAACLLIGVCLQALAIAPEPPASSFQGAPGKLAVGLAVPAMILQSAYGLGWTRTLGVHGVPETSYVGTPVKQLFPNYIDPGAVRVLVVTIRGCHACERAISDFKAAHVAITTTTFCGTLTRSGCFVAPDKQLAPLTLLVDARGIIVKQHSGWTDAPAEAEKLTREFGHTSLYGKE